MEIDSLNDCSDIDKCYPYSVILLLDAYGDFCEYKNLSKYDGKRAFAAEFMTSQKLKLDLSQFNFRK